jgi:hypothetical protein
VIAFLLSHAAHHEWGFSDVAVQSGALLAAILIATLLATEFLGKSFKSLRKPK